MLQRIKCKDFSLKHTVECGQLFRWKKQDEYYYINSKDKFFRVKQIGNYLHFEGADKGFIRNFFRLNEDYKKIIKTISKDNHIKEAIKKYYGLRIIRQYPWECLISYLCSTASSIPMIKKRIDLLAKNFGKKIIFNNHVTYSFPEPGKIRDSKKLKNICKIGTECRIKGILEADKVKEAWLLNLKNLDYLEAKKRLEALHGVGPKVADCVLLFSLDFLQAFPVDTWVKKIMKKYYKQDGSDKKIVEFAQKYFGKYAGYAQEFLFYAERVK